MSEANSSVQPSASRGDRPGATGPRTVAAGLDQPPPFWSRWERIYLVVAALLAVQIGVFWLLTRWAS